MIPHYDWMAQYCIPSILHLNYEKYIYIYLLINYLYSAQVPSEMNIVSMKVNIFYLNKTLRENINIL